MGTNERENEEMGVVDHMDELMHLLSSAPTSRQARNELRQILAELREEQQRLQQQPERGETMTVRQLGYLEALGRRPEGGPRDEPTRKQAAGLVLEALELAMFQREEPVDSADDASR